MRLTQKKRCLPASFPQRQSRCWCQWPVVPHRVSPSCRDCKCRVAVRWEPVRGGKKLGWRGIRRFKMWKADARCPIGPVLLLLFHSLTWMGWARCRASVSGSSSACDMPDICQGQRGGESEKIGEVELTTSKKTRWEMTRNRTAPYDGSA